MVLSNYDLYDIHAVLVNFRSEPLYEYNGIIASALKQLVRSADDTTCDVNAVRHVLADIVDLDREKWRWVYVENVYTYGLRFMKDQTVNRILSAVFEELLVCIEQGDAVRIEELADAAHNIPIVLAESSRNAKKEIKAFVKLYRKTYNPLFLSEKLKQKE